VEARENLGKPSIIGAEVAEVSRSVRKVLKEKQ